SFHVVTNPCSKSSPSDRYNNHFDIGLVFQNFHAGSSLPFNDPVIIKRRNKGHIVALSICQSFLLAGIKCISRKDNFYLPIAEHFRLAYFLFWCCSGHKNHAFHFQPAAGKSKALCMVSGTGTDNTPQQLLIRQGTNHVISAPKFIGTHY